MKKSTCQEVLQRLYAAFGVRHPVEDRLVEIAWEDTTTVPDGVVHRVEQIIRRESDSLPRNIGKAINQAWIRLQSEQPEIITNDKESLCHDCVNGYILYKKNVPGFDGQIRETEFAIECASCHPDKKHATTAARLKKAGYKVRDGITRLYAVNFSDDIPF